MRDLALTKPRRTLRAGFLSTLPTRMLEAIITRHKAQSSGEQLEIVDGSEHDLKSRLDDDAIDLALTILRPGAERFEKESLYQENYVLVVSRHHRLAQSPRVAGEELAQDSMIIRRHCEVLAATSRYFTQRGVRPSFGLKTTNDDRALALVRARLGVTVMPESFTDPDTRQIKLADFELSREIGLIFSAAVVRRVLRRAYL